MMHRQYTLSSGVVRHRPGLFWIAMHTNPGVVRTNRHDREIDSLRRANIFETGGVCRVAAKHDTPVRNLDNVAVVAAIDIAPHARAPMRHFERCDSGAL